LRVLDPVSAEKIDPNNQRRITRALEVSLATNQPFSEQTKKEPCPKNILYLAIDVPRDKLYQKIDQRVEHWFKTGLINETKMLVKKYSLDLPSMSSLGYAEINDYLNNKITLDEAIETMEKRTHHYAKRQLTWFSKNKDIIWVNQVEEAENLIKEFLSKEA
jgi:tRNA dimethylallyltransferase